METEKSISNKMFEIRLTNANSRNKGGVFGYGRLLLGRTESCDLIVNHDAISAVHAVLEITETRVMLYDMNSTNGTYVNDNKIVAKELFVGDFFRLADVEFEFQIYSVEESLPPVLDTLEPAHGKASVKTPLLSEVAPPTVPKSLPNEAPAVSSISPSIVYPLASDPKAEFSEYIFEDKDDLYPIFKYETVKQAVEVIILFNDKVFSVDYLSEGNATYHIAGLSSSEEELEFPYLAKDQKYPFVNVSAGSAVVHTIPGFGVFLLSDKKKDSGHVATAVELTGQDLLRLQKGNLQIFVRNVSAPPRIAAAPILKRDPQFRNYLSLSLIAFALFVAGIKTFPLAENVRSDDYSSARLASILEKLPSHKKPEPIVVKIKKTQSTKERPAGHVEAFSTTDFPATVDTIVTKENKTKASDPVLFSELHGIDSLNPVTIRATLMQSITFLRSCYTREIGQLLATEIGTIELSFIIGASGNVAQAGIDAKSPLPVTVKKCVVDVVKGIRFPVPASGIVEVKQKINYFPK